MDGQGSGERVRARGGAERCFSGMKQKKLRVSELTVRSQCNVTGVERAFATTARMTLQRLGNERIRRQAIST